MLNLSLPSHKAFRSSVQKGGSKMAVGFFEAFIKIWDHCFIEWEERGPNKTFLTDFFKELSIYGFISVNDILLCLCLGVLITILRYFLTVALFKVGVLQDYLSLFWSQVLLRDGLPLVHVIKNLHWFSLFCVTSGIRFVLVKVNYTGFARKQVSKDRHNVQEDQRPVSTCFVLLLNINPLWK